MNNILKQVKSDAILNKIVDFRNLHYKEAQLFLVGGAVRDFFLKKNSTDRDLIVNNVNPHKFAMDLASELDATFIPLDEENKIYRLVLRDKLNFIDIAAMIDGSIDNDLRSRDFTINSIAVNLIENKIFDINEGLKDLELKKIKPINEQNFIDDPLRLLRAFRFASTLSFDIDKELLSLISKHKESIRQSSVERINYEILKMFSGENCHLSLLEMNNCGLLSVLFPIIEELKKIPENMHHHLNLFFHSIETVKQIQQIYNTSNQEVKEHLDENEFGGATRLAHLKFAGFFHDIGKPQCWTIEEETGRHRFIKHDDVGAKISQSLFKKNKFSKKQISYISKLIKYHIYPSHVVSAPELNEKIYMRFVRKMEEESIDVIILAMADRLSARGVEITEEIVEKNIRALNDLLSFYLRIKEEMKPLPKLLDGEEIMNLLDITPSRELGEIISALKEAQISGEVQTKDEAIEFILASKNSPLS